MGNISIVIGSWGSYNECNERALGSKWLDLSDYDEWSEIEEELKKEGFKLDGIDEELFVQDIDGLPSSACNWDCVNPQDLYEILKESEVLIDDYKYEVLNAYIEVRTFQDFTDLVNSKGSRWDEDIHFYKNYDWSDYGKMIFDEYCYKIPEQIEQFIDYESYGKYMGDYYAEECTDGIIEIVN